MDTQQIINQAIEQCAGETMEISSPAAHPSDSMTYELVRYEDGGRTAVLEYAGVTKRFPANEIFNPNRARDIAMVIKLKQLNQAALRDN